MDGGGRSCFSISSHRWFDWLRVRQRELDWYHAYSGREAGTKHSRTQHTTLTPATLLAFNQKWFLVEEKCLFKEIQYCRAPSVFGKLNHNFFTSWKHGFVLRWGSLWFSVAGRQLQWSNSFPGSLLFLSFLSSQKSKQSTLWLTHSPIWETQDCVMYIFFQLVGCKV